MPKFRKRAIIIEAVRWTGDNYEAIEKFTGGVEISLDEGDFGSLIINTLEGKMKAKKWDYIIKEPFPTADRKFYPCKPDIFEATYEKVE